MAGRTDDVLADTLSVFGDAETPSTPLTTSEVAADLDCTRRTAYDRLDELVDRGELRTKKVGARGRVWWRDPADADDGGTERLERHREDLLSELDEVFERIDDAFYAVDETFRFTYVNERAAELLQRPAEELLGERVWDVYPEAAETDAWDAFHAALERQEPTSYELFFEPLGFWVEANVYPSETGLSVYFRDVTERKERERELELYERIAETVDDGIYAIDEDDRFVLVNEAFCEMVGWEREELVGSPATTVYDDDLAPEAAAEAAEVTAGRQQVATLELELHTRDGDRIPVESRFGPFPYGDGYGRCGVVRDVSERKERERELVRQRSELEDREEALRRAYQVIADPDRTFEERVEDLLGTVRDALGTDYATLSRVEGDEYVFEAVAAPPDADVEAGDTVPLAATNCERAVATARTLVLDDVEADAPDLAERAGNREWGIACYLGAPVPVGDDVYGTFCFYDVEARTDSFTDWEVTFVELLANWVGNELERRQYTDQLAALNELNEVVREITDAVIDQSTREEIEATACEQLSSADSYEFAWIAELDPTTGAVESRTEAGVDGYLADVDHSIDPDADGQGPVGAAFRSGEVQVVPDVFDDPPVERWRDHADTYGFRSFAAVPISHEETVYGVLGLHSTRSGAFDDGERTVVRQLGEVVGHAIAAVDRKQALMSDELVELEFHMPDVFETLDVDTSKDGAISLEEIVSLTDGEFLVYGSVTGDGGETLAALADALPHWDAVTFRDDDATEFELKLLDPPVLSAVASLGGAIEQAVVEDGDYRMTIHLSPSVDVRRVIDRVREHYPSAEMVARRQISRVEDATERAERVLTETLTDRQRAALRAAFHSGFFTWPRESSGEEVAETLGVAPPTFHQHLRRAEQKVFESLLEPEEYPER